MNLLELHQICHDKPSSVAFLQQRGILHNHRYCTAGHPMTLCLGTGTQTRDKWRCHLRSCRKDVPLRQNTWLEGSRLPFRSVILFLLLLLLLLLLSRWSYRICLEDRDSPRSSRTTTFNRLQLKAGLPPPAGLPPCQALLSLRCRRAETASCVPFRGLQPSD